MALAQSKNLCFIRSKRRVTAYGANDFVLRFKLLGQNANRALLSVRKKLAKQKPHASRTWLAFGSNSVYTWALEIYLASASASTAAAADLLANMLRTIRRLLGALPNKDFILDGCPVSINGMKPNQDLRTKKN